MLKLVLLTVLTACHWSRYPGSPAARSHACCLFPAGKPLVPPPISLPVHFPLRIAHSATDYIAHFLSLPDPFTGEFKIFFFYGQHFVKQLDSMATVVNITVLYT